MKAYRKKKQATIVIERILPKCHFKDWKDSYELILRNVNLEEILGH